MRMTSFVPVVLKYTSSVQGVCKCHPFIEGLQCLSLSLWEHQTLHIYPQVFHLSRMFGGQEHFHQMPTLAWNISFDQGGLMPTFSCKAPIALLVWSCEPAISQLSRIASKLLPAICILRNPSTEERDLDLFLSDKCLHSPKTTVGIKCNLLE